MSVAGNYCRNHTDAKDILSQSFIKAFKSIHAYDSSKGSFHAWLKKIIGNEAIDYMRQRSRFSTVEMEQAEEPHIESAVLEKMDAAAVMSLIQQLPPATHAVFVLYVLDGHTHKEIAQQLSISEGTSKWHLSEARKILQHKILNIKNS